MEQQSVRNEIMNINNYWMKKLQQKKSLLLRKKNY